MVARSRIRREKSQIGCAKTNRRRTVAGDGDLPKQCLVCVEWIEIVVEIDADRCQTRIRLGPRIIKLHRHRLSLNNLIGRSSVEFDEVWPVAVIGGQSSSIVGDTCT